MSARPQANIPKSGLHPQAMYPDLKKVEEVDPFEELINEVMKQPNQSMEHKQMALKEAKSKSSFVQLKNGFSKLMGTIKSNMKSNFDSNKALKGAAFEREKRKILIANSGINEDGRLN